MKTYGNTLNEVVGIGDKQIPGYVVVWDEPIGLCVGFEPPKSGEFETNKYIIIADDGGSFYKYVDSAFPGGNGAIAIVSKWDHDCEPHDNYLWRSKAEFDEWFSEFEEE